MISTQHSGHNKPIILFEHMASPPPRQSPSYWWGLLAHEPPPAWITSCFQLYNDQKKMMKLLQLCNTWTTDSWLRLFDKSQHFYWTSESQLSSLVWTVCWRNDKSNSHDLISAWQESVKRKCAADLPWIVVNVHHVLSRSVLSSTRFVNCVPKNVSRNLVKNMCLPKYDSHHTRLDHDSHYWLITNVTLHLNQLIMLTVSS